MKMLSSVNYIFFRQDVQLLRLCSARVLTKCVVNAFSVNPFITAHCNARTSVYISSYCSMHSRRSYRGVHTMCARAYNASVTLCHVASIIGFPAGERPRSVPSTRIRNPFLPAPLYSLSLFPSLSLLSLSLTHCFSSLSEHSRRNLTVYGLANGK